MSMRIVEEVSSRPKMHIKMIEPANQNWTQRNMEWPKQNEMATPTHILPSNRMNANIYFCCRFNAQSMHNIYLAIKATGEAIKVHSILYLCMFYLCECVLQMAFDREYIVIVSLKEWKEIHTTDIFSIHTSMAHACAHTKLLTLHIIREDIVRS